MTQRSFTLVYLAIVSVAVGIMAFNRLTQANPPSPSPSASDNNSRFNNQTPPPGNLNLSPPSPGSPAAQPRMFKNFTILPADQLQNKTASIITDKGEIDFKIYPEATKAASSFIFLAQNNFFNGLIFHRVEPGFVIQGGDPNGNGRGGPGYQFGDELNDNRTYLRGIVAMANAGPDTNGSQFFIMLADHPELPKKYTIFGVVTSGQDVVNQIKAGDVMRKVTVK